MTGLLGPSLRRKHSDRGIPDTVFSVFNKSGEVLTQTYPGAGFTKGLRLRLSQGLKSESFVFAKSWT